MEKEVVQERLRLLATRLLALRAMKFAFLHLYATHHLLFAYPKGDINGYRFTFASEFACPGAGGGGLSGGSVLLIM